MKYEDSPEAILRDAEALAVDVGLAQAAAYGANTDRTVLDVAARQVERAPQRAERARSSNPALTAAGMQRLDPEVFARRVRLRRQKEALVKRLRDQPAVRPSGRGGRQAHGRHRRPLRSHGQTRVMGIPASPLVERQRLPSEVNPPLDEFRRGLRGAVSGLHVQFTKDITEP